MSKKLRALLEQKDGIVREAKNLMAQATTSDRDLTQREQARYDALISKLDGINAEIEAERAEIEAERNAPVAMVVDRATGMMVDVERPATGVGRTFSSMFPSARRSTDGFNGLGEYLSLLNMGLNDQRLVAAAAGGSEGVGTDGGFMVPTEFAARALDGSLENEVVRPRANVVAMESNIKHVAGWNTLNHSSSIGGFDGQWLGEAGQMTVQKGLITRMILKAHKLGVLTAATNELIADSPYFERQLQQALVQAIGFYLDKAFLVGDGVGKPRGVLNDPALISVAKESGQAADTITWNNLKAMFARLHPASVRNAVWVANPSTRVQLLGLVQHVENQAGTDNVGGTWIPALRNDGQGGFTILGMPVVFSEKVPTLGDKGDIMLVDFSQYMVGIRSVMTIARSQHVGFDTDESHFRVIVRADGMGMWEAPVTPENGSTLSWCVTLDERA